jgi:hypothetical protein
MKRDLGRFDLDCDAPAHDVVEATTRDLNRDLNLDRPLDSPWCRADKARSKQSCPGCARMPTLLQYEFNYRKNGKDRKQMYWFGQCQRCRTIYWKTDQPENTAPAPASSGNASARNDTRDEVSASSLIAAGLLVAAMIFLWLVCR